MASAHSGKDAGALPPPLGVGLQVSYGMGSIALGIGGILLLPSLLTLFFNQVVGMPAIWVGAAIMAAVVIDSITDPLIGLFSDRLRSPLGRRHTLMYASAIPAALGFWLMWQAPEGLHPAALFAYVVAILLFVNVSFSLYEIPSLALAPELAPDYDQRSKLIAYRWLFLVLGAAAINFALYQVYLREDAANPLGVLNRDRWEQFGLLAAATIFVTIVASTLATHRRIKLLHTPPAQRPSFAETVAELRIALTHRPLVMLMLGGLMMGFAAGTQFGLSNYLSLHFWGLKPQELSYLVVGGLAASFIALWAGPWLGGRLGKKHAILVMYFAWLVVTVVPIGLRLVNLMPPNGSSALLAILVANYTLGLSLAVSCHINLGSCVADAIDDIAVRTGRRSEGVMFAAYTLLDKWANGGGAFAAGAILSLIAFPTRALPGTVDPGILREMALIATPIVALGSLGSMAFLSQYGLTRADHERNARILAERRAGEATAGPRPTVVAAPDVAPGPA